VAELTFHRCGPAPVVKTVCMYCGRPATRRDEFRVKNPRHDLPDGPRGPVGTTDPSGCLGTILALIWLCAATVAAGARLAAWWRQRTTTTDAPLVPADTLVVVTTCDRHANYPRWYARVTASVGLGVISAVVAGVAFVPLERLSKDPLAAIAVCAMAAVILLLAVFVRAPVRVTTVRRDSVLLGNVRPAYFATR
jgi:hypothetical protein